jgi:DNA-binding transcriptional ArsR family regulator
MSPRPEGRRAPRRSARQARPAQLFAALGDETRLALVGALCAGGALSTAQLTAATTISRQAVTKHLQVLAQAGLASNIRDGRERLWQFEPAPLAAAMHSLELIGRQWDRALLRLKAAVER